MSANDDPARQLALLADARLSRAVHVAATLGVADHLADEPRPVAELADRTSVDAEALYRLLRYLAHAGVFTAAAGRRFGLTPMGRLLRRDEPGSLRDQLVIGTDDRALWWSTGELLHTVRTGKPAYEHVYGQSLWETMRANSGSTTRFQQAMTDASEVIVAGLLRGYDWSGVGTVADVGGGSGAVLARLLADLPRARGVVVDQPSVVPEAEKLLAAAGLADRCSAVAGDLFGRIPATADVFLLVRILHDWPDDAALAVLRACRTACGDTGRLLVVDMEVRDDDPTGLTNDILMMLLVGGRERSAEELAELLGAAGFTVTRRIGLTGPYTATEARPNGMVD